MGNEDVRSINEGDIEYMMAPLSADGSKEPSESLLTVEDPDDIAPGVGIEKGSNTSGEEEVEPIGKEDSGTVGSKGQPDKPAYQSKLSMLSSSAR